MLPCSLAIIISGKFFPKYIVFKYVGSKSHGIRLPKFDPPLSQTENIHFSFFLPFFFFLFLKEKCTVLRQVLLIPAGL